jgi:Kef-type K+ transport system membrane component KefB
MTLAQSPIALFIAESLKPVRDFFLILFFFSLGAGLNLRLAADVLVPAAPRAIS